MWTQATTLCLLFVCFHSIWAARPDFAVVQNSNLLWVKSTGTIPPNAVYAGEDPGDGGQMYIGRTSYENEVLPGKVLSKTGTLFIPYLGYEYEVKEDFEILTASSETRWLKLIDLKIPTGAVWAGYNKVYDEKEFFVCRGSRNGVYIPGKMVQPTLCQYPWNGQEIQESNDYEILVI